MSNKILVLRLQGPVAILNQVLLELHGAKKKYRGNLCKSNSFSTNRNALAPLAMDYSVGSFIGLSTVGAMNGIAHQPAVCGPLSRRTAVVKAGDWIDMKTAEVFCFYFIAF